MKIKQGNLYGNFTNNNHDVTWNKYTIENGKLIKLPGYNLNRFDKCNMYPSILK